MQPAWWSSCNVERLAMKRFVRESLVTGRQAEQKIVVCQPKNHNDRISFRSWFFVFGLAHSVSSSRPFVPHNVSLFSFFLLAQREERKTKVVRGRQRISFPANTNVEEEKKICQKNEIACLADISSSKCWFVGAWKSYLPLWKRQLAPTVEEEEWDRWQLPKR